MNTNRRPYSTRTNIHPPTMAYHVPIWKDEKEVKPRRDWNPHHVSFARGFGTGFLVAVALWLIREIVR